MLNTRKMYNRELALRKCKTLEQLRLIMNLDWLKHKNYTVISGVDELKSFIPEIMDAPLVAFDIESSGTQFYNLSRDNPLRSKILGFSLAWKKDCAIYVPVNHVTIQNIDIHIAFALLYHIWTTKRIVTHNGLFDGKVMYSEGVRLNIVHDTMLLYFNLDSTVSKGSKGLKPLTHRMYGYDVIELSDIFGTTDDYGLFAYLDTDLIGAYACADADHTLSLFNDSIGYLKPSQYSEYLSDIEVQNQLIRSEYYGKGVDLDLCQMLSDSNKRDMQIVENIIYHYVGYRLSIMHNKSNLNNVYRFNLTSNSEVAYVMFTLLGYPIMGTGDSGRIKADSFVLDALEQESITDEDTAIDTPIMDRLIPNDILFDYTNYKFDWLDLLEEKDKILIQANVIRGIRYKLATLIKVYRALDKQQGTFFDGMLSRNCESKLFTDIGMISSDTSRLIDVFQTLKGALKRFIVPYNPKTQYLIDTDYNQIEFHVMVGQSHMSELTERLSDSETDFHLEAGSLIINKPPYKITKSERSALKPINFGIAYKMGASGILKREYGIGISKEKKKKYLKEIKDLLVKWDLNLHPIKALLTEYRKKSITVVDRSTLPPFLRDKPRGVIQNAVGRARIFDLSGGTQASNARVERQSGNFPIQSYARHIFCRGFVNLCHRFIKDGLMDIRVSDKSTASGYRFDNKVYIMGLIHDEFLMCADRDINYKYLYKVILDECMIQVPNEPTYFCGISIASNWYDAHHLSNYEAPVNHIKEIAGTNPPIFVEPSMTIEEEAYAGIEEYIHQRILNEIKAIVPECLETHMLNVPEFIDHLESYYVRNKLKDYYGKWRPVDKSEERWDDTTADALEVFLTKEFGEFKFLYPTGSRVLSYDTVKQSILYDVVLAEDESEFNDTDNYTTDSINDLVPEEEGSIQNIRTAFDLISQVYGDS
jgi:DNA polymerase I-like protein with 3'-5' exonuclease and polymerase domains